MKTICLVIHSLQAGGMERVMAELANHFSRKENVEVHLILYGIKRDIFYTLNKNIHLHKPAFVFNDASRKLSTLKTWWYLRKKIKALKPDAVLSFGEGWNSFVLLATLGLRLPVFVSDRGQPDKNIGSVQHTLRRWLYPFAKGVIAQTATAKKIYHTLYKHSNIQTIGNPVRAINAGNRQYERKNIVLMVGRLINTKHQDKLIELFVKINHPQWKLVLVGYDHLKQQHMQRLKELVIKMGAAESVELAGKQADVDRYYLGSKIFAFTSSSEGFPNVIGEAMSAGLPVVAFDCVAGPSEMIADNINGFLIPLFDYDQFQHKLSLLMENETLRESFGWHARESIQRFSIATIGDTYFDFILMEPSPNGRGFVQLGN